MEIFPAIDLCSGRVVRLLQGNYQKMTVYAEHPEKIAAQFEACGAKYLHAVDLDGAKDGTMRNSKAVRDLVKSTSLKVEIGGGIRDEAAICEYLDCGVFRVILGTIAVKDPDFTGRMLARYGNKIAIGVDLKDGVPAVNGWLEDGGLSCEALCDRLRDQGCRGLICTDISKDGMLSGTNRAMYARLMEAYPMFEITASGGVSSLDDICALKEMGMFGAIIGKAYYEGWIDLRKAIEVAA